MKLRCVFLSCGWVRGREQERVRSRQVGQSSNLRTTLDLFCPWFRKSKLHHRGSWDTPGLARFSGPAVCCRGDVTAAGRLWSCCRDDGGGDGGDVWTWTACYGPARSEQPAVSFLPLRNRHLLGCFVCGTGSCVPVHHLHFGHRYVLADKAVFERSPRTHRSSPPPPAHRYLPRGDVGDCGGHATRAPYDSRTCDWEPTILAKMW